MRNCLRGSPLRCGCRCTAPLSIPAASPRAGSVIVKSRCVVCDLPGRCMQHCFAWLPNPAQLSMATCRRLPPPHPHPLAHPTLPLPPTHPTAAPACRPGSSRYRTGGERGAAPDPQHLQGPPAAGARGRCCLQRCRVYLSMRSVPCHRMPSVNASSSYRRWVPSQGPGLIPPVCLLWRRRCCVPAPP